MPAFRRFTDRDGRRWRVYEYSIIAGRVIYATPGAGGAQYKGFVPDPRSDGRPRRMFMMLTNLHPEDRAIDPATLQRQLDDSDVWWADRPTPPSRSA